MSERAIGIERIPRPLVGLAQMRRDCGRTEILNGCIGALFAMTGPVAVILTAAAAAGLTQVQISSWIFGVFVLNGLLTILASWLYRLPLAFFWTIPGTVVVGQSATDLPWSEVLGAYLVTAVVLVLLGVVGRVDKMLGAVPPTVVMAMVAGVFLTFGTTLVSSVQSSPAIAVPMVAVFVLAQVVPRIGRWVPPILLALAAGVIAVLVTGEHGSFAYDGSPLAAPVLQAPTFSWVACAELVLPLVVTVVFVQNAQGMAVLDAAGHRTPIRFATAACGVLSAPAAAIGAVSTCVAGPTNALLTASGERSRQYMAAVVCGLVAVVFGLVAPAVTGVLQGMPAAFIAVLAGLALFRALASAFWSAFSTAEVTAPLVTFLVTCSGVNVANLGAPFWGLLAGVAAHLLVRHSQARS